MLADRIRRFVSSCLEELNATHLPGLSVPRVFAGHEVGADTRADLAFTLGLLAAGGVDVVAGMPVEDALRTVLRETDGRRTETFASYRVAETVARYGPFDGNPLLAPFTDAQRAEIAEACDSRHNLAHLRTARLSPNYTAVLARCEMGRQSLGLPIDVTVLDELVDRTRTLLTAHPEGYLDDSVEHAGHFDIYTADVYLFTEPLAERLGPVWRSGAANALALVERVDARNGAAIGWGRSTGALSICLTIELAGLAVRHRLLDDERTAAWLARAERAFDSIRTWFSDGLITAHQYRSTYGYRGPRRRLQMTLDCLSKLADAANALDGVADSNSDRASLIAPALDEIIWFDEPNRAGVWTYRSPDLAFVLPMVGSTVTDYLAAPRNPGLFEVPVDSGLVTGVPVAFQHGARFAPAELPESAVKLPGGLELAHASWPEAGPRDTARSHAPLVGRRHARYLVEGRTLRVSEDLSFETAPDALALQVAETLGRPLRVEFEARDGDHSTVVDTAGLAEYRSFWAELPRVHQIDLRPGTHVSFTWSVTPLLRVMSREFGHRYDVSLYAPLADRVAESSLPPSALDGDAAALADCDIFHLHWPESMLPCDLERHQTFIETLRAAEVRIVWTQHNLIPHQRDPRWRAVYEAWASAADAVIHHSEWGRARALDRYRYAPRTVHRVIPHGHFGALMREVADLDRGSVEASLGLRSGVLRLGIVGAPREEKRVDVAMAAVGASKREDIELLVFAAPAELEVPDDPRIVVLPHAQVIRAEYNRRLATLDAVLMPFDDGEMLTTGAVADAVGLGLPSLISDWPYLSETLGDAAIRYGSTAQDLTSCLDSLDRRQLKDAASAANRLREGYDWQRIAERHFDLLELVGTAKL
jgi:glycosyltransferase involved in cell wall biosynthesis